ncbi:hypothetical protein M6B38_324015 [Iris pallida]|uniref:Uncharacterized protein n=1 Tax=Iris pallida TaxID=29817 RepID=A0AAX6H9L0_IRIPA|nr:hypothetical protein M6B38_324015 [Iris pallida]
MFGVHNGCFASYLPLTVTFGGSSSISKKKELAFFIFQMIGRPPSSFG